MMSNQTNVLIAIIALIFVSHSWYIHYRVKDGLARLMLLWGCGILAIMLVARICGYLLRDFEVLTEIQLKLWNQYNFWGVYAIIIGQYIIQRGRSQRNEDDKLQSDKKELKKFRKDKNDTIRTTDCVK